MGVVTSDRTAFEETVVFLSHFRDLDDPRQRGKVQYPLDEVLLLCLLAVLAGAETMTDIALFGRKKLDLLRRFRPFAMGTPAHDHLGDILAVLDPEQFQRCFVAWVAALTGTPDGVVAIDGKTARRSGRKAKGQEPIHVVSAFATRQRLVMGQIKVAEKSNEIVAIPKLLDMLTIEGAVITIDAMGCQRAIAAKIREKKADYLLALKGNQGALRDDVEVFIAEQKAVGFRDAVTSHAQSVDGDHGRIETRSVTVIHDIGWIKARHDWPDLNAIVVVESEREIGPRTERETRLYITSLTLVASLLAPMVRSHWLIENGLHWVLDMVFRDDECRLSKDHAPANFCTIKHMAQNLTRRTPEKLSLRAKRKAAAWDDDFLVRIITG